MPKFILSYAYIHTYAQLNRQLQLVNQICCCDPICSCSCALSLKSHSAALALKRRINKNKGQKSHYANRPIEIFVRQANAWLASLATAGEGQSPVNAFWPTRFCCCHCRHCRRYSCTLMANEQAKAKAKAAKQLPIAPLGKVVFLFMFSISIFYFFFIYFYLTSRATNKQLFTMLTLQLVDRKTPCCSANNCCYDAHNLNF